MADIEKNKEKILAVLNSIDRPGMDLLIKYLQESDFFTAPASTKYHGAYEGGLAEHSLFVWYVLQNKNDYYKLNLSPETIAITALLHDVCKIGFYKKGFKNVKKGKKDNGYGKQVDNWVEEEIWECEDQFPMGHGEKSVIQVMKYIPLEDLEIAMIRWHMGGYVPKDEYRELSNAAEIYPAIIALHAADLEVSHLIKTGGNEG